MLEYLLHSTPVELSEPDINQWRAMGGISRKLFHRTPGVFCFVLFRVVLVFYVVGLRPLLLQRNRPEHTDKVWVIRDSKLKTQC